MNMEDELRALHRPTAAPDDFHTAVLAHVERRRMAGNTKGAWAAPIRWRWKFLVPALAAMLVLALAGWLGWGKAVQRSCPQLVTYHVPQRNSKMDRAICLTKPDTSASAGDGQLARTAGKKPGPFGRTGIRGGEKETTIRFGQAQPGLWWGRTTPQEPRATDYAVHDPGKGHTNGPIQVLSIAASRREDRSTADEILVLSWENGPLPTSPKAKERAGRTLGNRTDMHVVMADGQQLTIMRQE